MPTDLRAEHVLTAATLSFLQHGFAGTSMHAVAEASGVTKPVVYGLFGSKDELFAAVIDRASAEMSERLATATAERGESQLEPGLRAYLEYIRERRELWDPVLSSTQHDAVSAAAARLRDRQVEVVADAVRKGYEDLGVEPDPREVDGLAHFVAGSVEAVGRWWLQREDLDIEAVLRFLVASLAPSLASVRGRGRSVFDDPGAGPI